MGNDEVRAAIIHSGVGGITESDVLLAKGSGAPIIGFNVRASKQAARPRRARSVEIRYYAIIYDLLDDIRGVLSGMPGAHPARELPGQRPGARGVRHHQGRQGGRLPRHRRRWFVAAPACGSSARTWWCWSSGLQSLRRFKDDVPEVTNGMECGMTFSGFQDIKVGDSIECFTLEAVARTL
jgi:translation initiation factor IF-2